jgi:hypothetical protein
MPNSKTCTISDELFMGFKIIIDLDYYYDTDEICKYVKEKLIASLDKIGLSGLSSTAKKRKFHLHDRDIYKLRGQAKDELIWICSHC